MKIDNKILDRVNSYKYLGVGLLTNSELSWVPHIRAITSKLASACGTLFTAKHCLDRHALRLILNTSVLSYVNYGILVWESAIKTALQSLTVILNRVVRCVNFRTTIGHIKMSQLYKDNKIFQLKDIYHLGIARFMNKYTNNKLPSTFFIILQILQGFIPTTQHLNPPQDYFFLVRQR